MSARRTKKTPRNKQLARQKAARAARRAEVSPLYGTPPPFQPYAEWLQAPESGAAIEMTPEQAGALDDETREFMRRVVEIAPIYNGHVPMAAVYLDMQLSRGEITLAVTGMPGQATAVKVADVAARLALAEAWPDGTEAALTADECTAKLHDLHRHGALVLDDDHIVHLAVPPTSPGGRWLLNGHATA